MDSFDFISGLFYLLGIFLKHKDGIMLSVVASPTLMV